MGRVSSDKGWRSDPVNKMIDNSGHTKPLFESRGIGVTPER
jgi:hypothetical protein